MSGFSCTEWVIQCRDLRAELAQARADLAERDAKLAVVMGVLEAHSTPRKVLDNGINYPAIQHCLATLPEQAKRLMEVVEAAKPVASEFAQQHPLIKKLRAALSNLSRPDGDGR